MKSGIISKVASAAALIVVLLLLATGIALHASGHLIAIAASDSMRASGIPIGSAYIAAPIEARDIVEGDFIAAENTEGQLVMHVALASPERGDDGRMWLRMKGSSSPGEDRAPYDVTEGAHIVAASAPGLGEAVAFFFHRHVWIPGLLAGALLAYAAYPLVRRLLPPRAPAEPPLSADERESDELELRRL